MKNINSDNSAHKCELEARSSPVCSFYLAVTIPDLTQPSETSFLGPGRCHVFGPPPATVFNRRLQLTFPVEGKITVNSLAESSPLWQNQISSVKMLGARGKLKFTRPESGLQVMLPDKMPSDIAFVLKISR